MKKVIDNASVPYGGYFVYKCPEDEFVIRAPFFNVLKSLVVKYRNLNSYPVGLQFDDEFEDNICQNAAPQVCADFIPPTLGEKAYTLATSLANYARSGFATVTPEEFERRKTICSECNYFGGTHSVVKVVCKRCGCSGLKIHIKTSVCPLPGDARKW